MNPVFNKSETKILGIHLFLALFITILGLNVWYLYNNFQNVSNQEGWVRKTHDVLEELSAVHSSISESESSIRGYVLMGQPDYLVPYQQQSVFVWKHVTRLKELTADNPEQQRNIKSLEVAIKARMEPLEKLSNYRRLSVENRKAAFEMGFIRMEVLRNQLQKIRDNETDLLAARTKSAEKSRSLFQWNVIGSFALTLTLILLAYWLIIRNERKNLIEIQNKNLQAWLNTKANEISLFLAKTNSLEKACEGALTQLAHTCGALAGNLYLKDSGRLKRVASFAGPEVQGLLSAPEQIENSTLVSEALKKDDIWMVQDLPSDSLKISSSLVSASPTALTFVPLQFQKMPLGVIELAFLKVPDPNHLQLLEEVREPLAVNLNSTLYQSRLQLLLEETQQQAEELQTQQEELRTNNEELEQQARALEAQQEIVHRQNEELERSRNSLETKAQDLEKISQYKSDFLAKMSHELRTPLNSLLILATLLIENKEKNLTDQQKDFAKTMYNSGNDLLNLINDILDLSKIEARKLQLRIEKFALGHFFERLKNTFEPQASSKKIDLQIEIAPELQNFQLQSDPMRLEQILRNFLSNAIKFTDKGQVRLKAGLQTGDPGRIRISVQDTGTGIPEEKKDLIFEAFEQADGSVSRKFGGTGLGLTISRELASLLGGQIELQSQENVGSEFSLILPLHFQSEALPAQTVLPGRPQTAAKPFVEQKNHEVQETAKAALKNLGNERNSILIVEDDRVFRKSMAETVESYGFSAIEADSSEVALQVLQLHCPTAILLDIKLPGMSGLGLLEAIKQDSKLRHIPVHMISALEYQTNALRMGALGYLSKPVTLDKVRSALTRIEAMIEKRVKNLLIIEDDERQREAVAQLVAGQDTEILLAGTGQDALSKVESQSVDCIILDLNLPDMSGFEFLERINSLPVSVPPIVIYTGKDLTRTEEQTLRKYSESIIIKGARSPERLLDEVNLFLHRVESLLPQEKQDILQHLRSQEKNFEGKTVLLVDDDLRNVFALTSALESKGLAVRIAKNGLEALESLSLHPDSDLVLMDLMMPKMDGLEAIRRIRQQSQFRDLPIIALTAKAMKEDQERCIEAGANDYLAKPLNLGNLLSVMRVWLTPKGIFL
ncbi:MAG: response regulator [Pseudobdellovibrionaceae bacterium]